MQCEACPAITSINFGGATRVLCQNCASSGVEDAEISEQVRRTVASIGQEASSGLEQQNAEEGQGITWKQHATTMKDHAKTWPRDTTAGVRHTNTGTRYGTTRTLASLASIVGWFIAALGIIAILIGLNEASSMSLSIMLSLGAGTIVMGLILVAVGQIMVAIVDNADHTREILEFLRVQNQSHSD